MNIGIIGSGHIGSALARRFGAIGHTVTVANSRGADSLSALTAETGAKAADVKDVVKGQDVVVITIPMNRIEDLPNSLFRNAPPGLVVIDTCNYYSKERDGKIDGIEAGATESAWVAEMLRHPVIKVFNNIAAQNLQERGKPKGAAGRIALPVAGDDAEAKAVVMKLVDELGFDPVDAGTIDESWRQEPDSPVYGKDFDATGVQKALASAVRKKRF